MALVAVLSLSSPGLGQPDNLFAIHARVLELRLAGNMADAIALAKRVVELSEKTLPPDDPFIKTSRDNLAALYEQARLALVEIDTLNRRVADLHRAGKPNEATPFAERSLELTRGLKGEDHADTASRMLWLAVLHEAMDRLADAEPLFKSALEIYETAVPPNSLGIAETANRLAGLYDDQGRLDEAEALYKRALAINEALPTERLSLARTLAGMARVYSRQGKPAESEALFKRTLEIRQAVQPSNHPDIAQALHNLGISYSNGSRHAEAELMLKRALQIIEQALPAGHPNIARVLNGLAFLHREQGRYAEAEPLHKRALEINEKAYPPGHLLVAASLYNLGLVYHAQQRLDEAEPLYRRALKIREKVLWAGHPDVAWSIHNLAGLHHAQGRLAEAEQLLQRALEMRAKVLPASDNAIVLNLNNLAAVEHDREAWELAVQYARRASTLVVDRARRIRRPVEIDRAETFRAELSNTDSPFVWFRAAAWRLAEQQPGRLEALSEEAYRSTQWISQSSAASALAQMAIRFSQGDGELARLVREHQNLSAAWVVLDKDVIAARSALPDRRDAAAEQALSLRVAEAEQGLAALSRRLAKDFPEYAALTIPEPLSLKATQELLQADDALVLFADGLVNSFIWVITMTDVRWLRIDLGTGALAERVAALRCGLDARLWDDAIDWPETTEEQVQQRKAQIGRRQRCEELLKAKPTIEVVGQASVQVLPFDLAHAHELYRALLGPVEDMIDGKRLMIVPSGPLTSLPFNALVAIPPQTGIPGNLAEYRQAAWLGARQPITVLPSVASLKALRQLAKTSQATKPYLGIGNPLLDGPQDDLRWGAHYKNLADLARARRCSTTPIPQQIASARGPQLAPGFASLFRGAQVDIEHVRLWTPLPETADELCEVGRRLGVPDSEILLGARATEGRVKELSEQGRLADYAIVHFATHGALTGQVKGSAGPGLILTPPMKGTSETKALERDDGFLTASEIATLKLDADWVILSACNTAGAQSENAEALSGMARAFFYAGARTLLVSHWEVGSDAAVKLTTRAFAELRSRRGIGRAEAMRISMRELMENGTLAEVHPSMWAPFAVVGEAGPQQRESMTLSMPLPLAPEVGKPTPPARKKRPPAKKVEAPDWRPQIWRQ